LSDHAWRVLKFKGVDRQRERYLDVDEATALIAACRDDLRQLVLGGLMTGARYSELVGLRCADVDLRAPSIRVTASKSGRARHVVLTDEGRALFAQLLEGKGGGDLVFTKSGEPWGKSHQFRPLREACARAGIAPAISFHTLRHSYASYLAMGGLPLVVIGRQIGHASTKMLEAHYVHLGDGYVRGLVRGAVPRFGQ
jgi:integrase